MDRTEHGADEPLDLARVHLARAVRLLRAEPPTLAGLRATVDGTTRVMAELTELIGTVTAQAPEAFSGRNEAVLRELRADLGSTHNCLTAGAQLLGPVGDDLRHLAERTYSRKGFPMFDEKPVADVADQQRPALPSDEPESEESEELEYDGVREADPADVADQRRVTPVLAEGEPWP